MRDSLALACTTEENKQEFVTVGQEREASLGQIRQPHSMFSHPMTLTDDSPKNQLLQSQIAVPLPNFAESDNVTANGPNIG